MLKTLYGPIVRVAEDLTKGKSLNFYTFFYGVIRLTDLPEEAIKEHFKEEEDQEDLALTKEIIDKMIFSREKIVVDGIFQVLGQAVCLVDEVDAFDRVINKHFSENEDIRLCEFMQICLNLWMDELQQIIGGKLPISGKNKKSFDRTVNLTSDLYQGLNERVRGQSEAIRLFVQGLFQGKILTTQENSQGCSSNVFLFSGPAGSGKASLAENTAALLDRELLTIDFNEYIHEEVVAERLFFPIMRKENDEEKLPPAGKVTDFVYQNSQGIILFKNWEYAEPKVISFLSRILDRGVIGEEGNGVVPVSLADVTIIFASTLGAVFNADDHEKNVSVLPQPMLVDIFKRELMARNLPFMTVDFFEKHFSANNIIMFNYVSLHYLRAMVQQTFAGFCQKMQETYGVVTEIDPMVTNVFLYTQSDASNAQATVRQSENFLKNELYELSRHLQKNDEHGFEKVETISFKVAAPEEDGPVRSLLVNETISEVLVIAEAELFKGVDFGSSFHVNFAKTYEEALEILKLKDIKFCVIDLYFRQEGQTEKFLSLDDIKSVGLECFEKLRRNVESLPFYVVDKNNMDREDKVTFLQRGVRDFLVLAEEKKGLTSKVTNMFKGMFSKTKEAQPLQGADVVAAKLDEIAQNVYVQEKRAMLNAKKRVLTFNTAQEVSEDGKHVSITFYDFSTRGTNLEGYDAVYDVVTYHAGTCLDDYIGDGKVKNELQHLAGYLTSPRQFFVSEGLVPGGVLLFGPEGVGKSVLAKALAGQADATFIAPSTNDIQVYPVEYLENIFKAARECAPSVIFIDNFDRLGLDNSSKGEALKGILRQNLLKNSKDLRHPVLFVGAVDFDDPHFGRDNTNMDVNLLVRMDYKIYVPLPDKKQRREFLQNLLNKAKVTTVGTDALENIVERSNWYTFDDLEGFFKIASRNAKRQGKDLDDVIFIGSLDDYSMGGKTERDERLHWEVAVHEAGHAYIQWKSGNRSAFATIIPRGDFGGYVLPKVEEKETFRGTQNEYLWKIRMCLASRAAEIAILEEGRGINSGIAQDFQMATGYALNYVCLLGMDGNWLVSMPPDVLLKSPMAGEIMQRVNNILQREFEETKVLIEKGKEAVEALAKALLDRNQLTGTEIDHIIEQVEKVKG